MYRPFSPGKTVQMSDYQSIDHLFLMYKFNKAIQKQIKKRQYAECSSAKREKLGSVNLPVLPSRSASRNDIGVPETPSAIVLSFPY